MTINTHVVFDNAFVGSLVSNQFPPDGLGTNSLGFIVNALSAGIPPTTCADAASTIDQYPALVNLSNDGTIFSRPVAGDFVCPSGNGSGQLNVQVAGINIGNVVITFTGGVPNLVFTTWPASITIDPTVNFSYGVSWLNGGSSGGLITYSENIPRVASFNTAAQFVSDNIAQCAIAPTALPSSPGAIKSANFTRIFNPLNLPLRSK